MNLKLASILTLALLANVHAQVLPPHSSLFGKTVGDCTVDYLRFFISLSTNQTTSPPPVGRADLVALPLWLSPPCIPVPNHQTSSIPENLYVLVPCQFVVFDNIDVDPPWTVEQLRQAAAACIDSGFLDLKLNIDAVPINLREYRLPTPAFGLTFHSADNFLTCVYGRPFVEVYDPVVADGHWVLVEPLAVGLHAFHFAATGTCFSASYDVKMYANVVEVPLEQWVEEFLPVVEDAAITIRNAPLLTHLRLAKRLFAAGHIAAGINQVRAFQTQTRLRVEPENPALATDFIEYAHRIIQRAKRDFK